MSQQAITEMEPWTWVVDNNQVHTRYVHDELEVY